MGRALSLFAGLCLVGKGGRKLAGGDLLVAGTPWRTFPRGLKRGLILPDIERRKVCLEVMPCGLSAWGLGLY